MKSDSNDTKNLLTRRIDSIIGEKELRTQLNSGKKLRIKHGVDPTTPYLHLGYSVVYHKLREFQDLGHTVIFLIGDFTGRFGDPTNKKEARQVREASEVKKLSERYIKQALTILDPKKTEIRYNSEWYDEMKAEELLTLMSHFTYAQMMERDMFQKRIKKHQEIGLHEPIYPVLQGYDSVMVQSDITVIGTDQTFNEMRGRDLQKDFGQKSQVIISVPLLIGLDGKRKMSQSLGNQIGITDDANDQYGKIMSLPDNQIYSYFELVTNVPTSDLPAIKKAIQKEPRDTKARLAHEIVKMYHGDEAAKKAEINFIGVFKKGGVPDDISEVQLKKATLLVDVMLKHGLANSKSEAKRLIEQRGVRVNHHIVSDLNLLVENKPGTIIQVGKRQFIQLS